MRVLVMGASCSGKSFYSRKLSSTYNMEMHDLDFVHFGKDFHVLAREERQQRLMNICAQDSWVACGSFESHQMIFESFSRSKIRLTSHDNVEL